MPIEYKNGNMFDAPTEAIVNTVNCVGVMGKGVALEFKTRWPENYTAYKKLCEKKLLVPGQMFVFENTNMFKDDDFKYLINFPTKKHWRSKSKIEYISEGLDALIYEIKKFQIKSISLPPLGCGNGGLDWNVVKEILEQKLSNIENTNILIFVPKKELPQAEFKMIPDEMTASRATLVKAIGDFEVFFGGHLTRLSIQKITYFLQIFGVNFGLSFKKEQFGPYSETLHKALKSMEAKNFIEGYSSDRREIVTTPSAFAAADEYLNTEDCFYCVEAIEKLSQLIEGYESPFGMELLASVHYLHTSENIYTLDEFVSEFSAWNDHKQKNFGRHEIACAIDRLSVDGLMN